ncbi:hypothetical protein [Ralstonia phage RP13]|nr:hypothetical protein [Ralstonia phage RP13]
MEINTYDFDGVVSTGKFKLTPGKDVIITGRTYEEAPYVFGKLRELGIQDVAVYFNTAPLSHRGDHNERARRISGMHKVRIIKGFMENHVVTHFEDDPVQIQLINTYCTDATVVLVPNNSSYYGEPHNG